MNTVADQTRTNTTTDTDATIKRLQAEAVISFVEHGEDAIRNARVALAKLMGIYEFNGRPEDFREAASELAESLVWLSYALKDGATVRALVDTEQSSK